MNIEKIKNFNQKILAVFGILGIIGLLIIFILGISSIIRNISYNRSNDDQEIVSNEIARENLKNNKRTHQITFENFELIDTAYGIYMLPVSQTVLEYNEFINRKDKSSRGILGLINSPSAYEFYYDYESFNNALIYNSKNESFTQLFHNRISINKIYLERIQNKTYLFMAVTKNDTNNDGKMDDKDFKTLFIYSPSNEKLSEIKSDSTDFNRYFIVKNREQIIIKYGLDKNNDGTHAWDEPMILKSYSLIDNKLNDFVNKELSDKLQGLLDGKAQVD